MSNLFKNVLDNSMFKLSKENLDTGIQEVVKIPPVSEVLSNVINIDSVKDNALDLVAKVQTEIDDIATAVEVRKEFIDQIATVKQQLNNPEYITSDDVKTLQQSIVANSAKLGADKEEILEDNLSYEDMETSPVVAMRVVEKRLVNLTNEIDTATSNAINKLITKINQLKDGYRSKYKRVRDDIGIIVSELSSRGDESITKSDVTDDLILSATSFLSLFIRHTDMKLDVKEIFNLCGEFDLDISVDTLNILKNILLINQKDKFKLSDIEVDNMFNTINSWSRSKLETSELKRYILDHMSKIKNPNILVDANATLTSVLDINGLENDSGSILVKALGTVIEHDGASDKDRTFIKPAIHKMDAYVLSNEEFAEPPRIKHEIIGQYTSNINTHNELMIQLLVLSKLSDPDNWKGLDSLLNVNEYDRISNVINSVGISDLEDHVVNEYILSVYIRLMSVITTYDHVITALYVLLAGMVVKGKVENTITDGAPLE